MTIFQAAAQVRNLRKDLYQFVEGTKIPEYAKPMALAISDMHVIVMVEAARLELETGVDLVGKLRLYP